MKIAEIRIKVRLGTEYQYLWYVEELITKLKVWLGKVLPKLYLNKKDLVEITYYVTEE